MAEQPLDRPYRGGFVGREHRFALMVYYEDTDAAGIVYYANYLKFMERARSDMLRAAGIDQRAEMERSGSVYAVADVSIRYRQPARLGDELVIVSTVEAVGAASVVIQQRVMRGAEEITNASVTVAFLSSDLRPQRQPRDWIERIGAFAADRNGDG
jgi:acyl-CoA thioester hydrolase